LIASMVKIAIQSALSFADDPAKILTHLSRVIGSQLHGQFVTAAYLYIDPSDNKALYSAAGHPPLYYRRAASGDVEQVVSNGLMICHVCQENYPVIEMKIQQGDQFILYTDGLTEAENKEGEQFGDRQFMSLLETHKSLHARGLNRVLYDGLKSWISEAHRQQDDFTWIIIDVKT
jgi:sigma-B regulation protein RsbU (phosphoserine phosphatase)